MEIGAVQVTDLPPKVARRGRQSKLYPELLKVQQTPGIWYQIAVYDRKYRAGDVARLLRKRKIRIPDGAWQFETRISDDGRSVLYARYDG